MNPKLIINNLALIALVACSHGAFQGERELKSSEIPVFLTPYRKNNTRFYEKHNEEGHTFEAKYYEGEYEVSLTFSDTGKLIEKEKDIEFEDLTEENQKKITSYLKENYPQYKLLEVEMRENEEGKSFIDVEIKHKSSKSGYWEMVFDTNGNFLSREVEDFQPMETMH